MKVLFDEEPLQVFRGREDTNFFTWNHKTVQVAQPTEDDPKATVTKHECDMVEVSGEPDFDKVFVAVIREKYSENDEMSLVNAYNAHVTGVKKDDAKVAEYKAMLKWRADKKDELKAVFGEEE